MSQEIGSEAPSGPGGGPGAVPAVEEIRGRLERAGWIVDDEQLRAARDGPSSGPWFVCGRHGNSTLTVSCSTRERAWRRAYEQAQAMGMVPAGPPTRGSSRPGDEPPCPPRDP
jgi:hypothetical protein